MKDIYEIILKGIQEQENLNDTQLVERLNDLQSTVRRLRRLYYNYPVHVPYEETDIQAAYLLVYFPHYYQLIYKTLLEEYPTIFKKKENLKLLYFGGGPGPEVYGTLKYIANNANHIKSVEVVIFDINATQWEYSHEILNGHILPSLGSKNVKFNFKAINFDLTAPFEKKRYKKYFNDCDLLVFQNCLNEIPVDDKDKLLSNIDSIIELVPPLGSVIINDLAGGYQAVKSLIHEIELQTIDKKHVSVVHSSCSTKQFNTLISVHSNPPPVIRDYLLINTDGLIPRKYIKYNYCFFSKTKIEKERVNYLGLRALYSPLDFKYLDANNSLQSKSFVGIDFGTSTTIVNLARVADGKIVTESINIEQRDIHGDRDCPIKFDSAIASTSKYLLFGKHAYSLKNELTLHKDIWHSFKNELGKNNVYRESVLKNDQDYKIADTNDAISLYFWYLKMKIENFIAHKKFPDTIKYAVTIPASFKEQQRTQFLKCLKNAGIAMNNNPFIDEPIAAFISCVYENHEEGLSLDTPKNILILDLGAGTCDISVLNVRKDENGIYAQNLSIARYGNIGGEKLDAMIAEKVLKEQFLDSIGNESETAYENAYNQICSIAEKVKIKLCKSIDVFPGDGFSLPDKASTEKIAWLPNQKTSEGIFSEPYISYKDFYYVMKEYCAFDSKVYGTIGYSVGSALDKANIESDDINYILLTGGGSRNPYFRSFVAEEFINSEILIPDNIQEHVARGCAIHSLILNAFGSFILPPVLSDEISLICKNETMKLFDSSTTAPSKEIIIENIVPGSLNQNYIDLPIVDGNDNQIIKVFSFKVKPKENYKAIFWIDADKTIECEVHSNQDIVLCHPIIPEKDYEVKNQFYFKP